MNRRFLLLLIVFACSLSFSASAQTPRYARVISENANLRDTPSIAGASEQEVEEGTIVKVLDEKLPWYVVRMANRVGWMHGNTLEFIGTQTPSSAPAQESTIVPDFRPATPPVQRRESSPEPPTRTTESTRGYIRGPRGGCYYFSGSGRKVYVDRSLCN